MRIVLGAIIGLAFVTGCSKVALERNVGTRPSDVTSADQLLDPTFLSLNVPGMDDCDTATLDSQACLLIMDSFERDGVQQPLTGDGFGWSSLVYDVPNSNGRKVTADIHSADSVGETPAAITGAATDQGRSLVYTGRPGSSVHSIYLVSKPINLQQFNSVFVAFEYLAIDLETWQWRFDGVLRTGNENIRIEVCDTSLDACGANPNNLDVDGLNSTNWSVHGQSEASEGQGRNLRNYVLADWNQMTVDIDLTGLSEAAKSNFVFRITVTLDEGFLDENQGISGQVEDAIALDNVIAMASIQNVVGNPGEGPIENPEPNPNSPSID